MYGGFGGGGLFGDLPTAKNEPRRTAGSTADPSIDDERATTTTTTTTTTWATAGGDDADRGRSLAYPAASDASASSNRKSPAAISLVGALGVAGTTMAFVPAALRARKRQASTSAVAGGGGGGASSHQRTVAASAQGTSRSFPSSGGGSEPKPEPELSVLSANSKKLRAESAASSPSSEKEEASAVEEEENNSVVASKSAYAYAETVLVSRGAAAADPAVVDVHAPENASATVGSVSGEPDGRSSTDRYEEEGGSVALKDEERQDSNANDEDDDEEAEEEAESLRRLHESVADPYDPYVPNDYLAYREAKKAEAIREEMERRAAEQLELQRKMRERIEEERRKAEASGDLDKIVESRRLVPQETAAGAGDVGGMGRGRGRGRGMSNLPAWLVRKRQEMEKKASSPPAEGAATNADGRFEDVGRAPSASTSPIDFGSDTFGKLVVLSNMVAPGEVDPELSDEVREECEDTCGPVRAVKVCDAAPPTWTQVRVFVLFEREEHAAKASMLFHGRKFGDRQITARLAVESDKA